MHRLQRCFQLVSFQSSPFGSLAAEAPPLLQSSPASPQCEILLRQRYILAHASSRPRPPAALPHVASAPAKPSASGSPGSNSVTTRQKKNRPLPLKSPPARHPFLARSVQPFRERSINRAQHGIQPARQAPHALAHEREFPPGEFSPWLAPSRFAHCRRATSRNADAILFASSPMTTCKNQRCANVGLNRRMARKQTPAPAVDPELPVLRPPAETLIQTEPQHPQFIAGMFHPGAAHDTCQSPCDAPPSNSHPSGFCRDIPTPANPPSAAANALWKSASSAAATSRVRAARKGDQLSVTPSRHGFSRRRRAPARRLSAHRLYSNRGRRGSSIHRSSHQSLFTNHHSLR